MEPQATATSIWLFLLAAILPQPLLGLLFVEDTKVSGADWLFRAFESL